MTKAGGFVMTSNKVSSSLALTKPLVCYAVKGHGCLNVLHHVSERQTCRNIDINRARNGLVLLLAKYGTYQ